MSNGNLIMAKVGGTYSESTCSLIFDGEKTETKKHYKYSTALYLKAGDRVVAAKVSGTYIIIAKII